MLYLLKRNKTCPICNKKTSIVYVGEHKEELCPFCKADFDKNYIDFKNLYFNDKSILICHISNIKSIGNIILRFLQFYTKKPYIIKSLIAIDNTILLSSKNYYFLVKYILEKDSMPYNIGGFIYIV